jgi:non-ribosomal peptide synthetase component E (peptide arylation enzyme)
VLGERACAYVIPRPGARPTLAEITRFLSEDKRIARFKLPERLELRERFPTTAVGKISKRDLREEIQGILREEIQGIVLDEMGNTREGEQGRT